MPPPRDILVEAAGDKLPHVRLVVRPDGATPSRQKVLRSLQDLEIRIAKTKEIHVSAADLESAVLTLAR